MERMRTLCLIGLLWMMTCILYAQNQLITYTVPGDGVELKDDFTVRVRQSGGGWKEVVTYPVKVDEVRQTKHHVELASMGYFDFSGQVEVSVTYNKGEVKSGRVRPLSYGITPRTSGSTITFTLDRPRNLSIISLREYISYPAIHSMFLRERLSMWQVGPLCVDVSVRSMPVM